MPSDTIILNPINRDLFAELTDWKPDVRLGLSTFCGIPVVFDSALPERFTEKIWHPPSDERFVCYGPEDEHWMRPLGLGTVEVIDKGPFVMVMQNNPNRKIEGIFSEVFRAYREPEPFAFARSIFKWSSFYA